MKYFLIFCLFVGLFVYAYNSQTAYTAVSNANHELLLRIESISEEQQKNLDTLLLDLKELK
jgi:hypothetical protein